MFKKFSQLTLTETTQVEVIHNPDFSKTNKPYIRTLDLKIAESKEAALDKSNNFDLEAEINKFPDSLFVKSFAIKANEINDNGDWFSTDELKKATHTFVGVPVFTNHQNSAIENAKGKVIHAWYDDEKDGIMTLMRIDATAYPDIARGIQQEIITGTSMGASRGHDLVTMSDGSKKRVDELQIGNAVITHTGEIELVADILMTKEHPQLYHIRWNGKESGLALSYEHPVLILKRENIYTKHSSGRQDRQPIEKLDTLSPEFVPASELKSGDYVLELIGNNTSEEIADSPVIQKNDSFFFQNYIAHRVKDVVLISNTEPTYYVQIGDLNDEKSNHSYILNDIATHNCFTSECRVLMSNGTYLPIKDVQPGDFVYTHKGNVREVKNTQIRPSPGRIRRISFEGFGSDIEITDNHKILTLKKQKLCACGCGGILPIKIKKRMAWKIKYKKRFLNGHSQRIWNTNHFSKLHKAELKDEMQSGRSFSEKDVEWKRADEFSVGDAILFPINSDCNAGDPDCTEEKSRLIGYFMAEGCYARRKESLYSVTFSFSLAEKDTYVKEVVTLLKKVFPDCRPCVIPKSKVNVCLVVVRNQEIAEWFYPLCGEYSHEKVLHPKILGWPVHYLKHIIGAYFNGDGCFSTRRADPRTGSIAQTVDAATVSHKMASQLHILMLKCGIYNRCYSSIDNKSIQMKVAVGAESVTVDRTILSNNVKMTVKPSFWLTIPKTYINILKPYMSLWGLSKQTRDYTGLRFTKIDKDLSYLVRKITNIETAPYDLLVHNLEVDGDHSYVVEDIAVKNCQVNHSLCSICHNLASVPTDYCSCITERKGKKITGKIKCEYHKNGTEDECPLCGCKKGEKKKNAVEDLEVHEKNYNLKFIENSVVVNPACHDCGITNIINNAEFIKKVAELLETLPRLIKVASETDVFCIDKSCVKFAANKEVDTVTKSLDVLESLSEKIKEIDKFEKAIENTKFAQDNLKVLEKLAGEKELNELKGALETIGQVSQTMIQQKENLDLEFASDAVKIMSDLQELVNELEAQGFGRLPSPGEMAHTEPETSGITPETLVPSGPIPTATPTPAPSKVQTGPVGGGIGTITGPSMASNKHKLNLGVKVAKKSNYLSFPIEMTKRKKTIK